VVANTYVNGQVSQQWDGTIGPSTYNYAPASCADATTHCTTVTNALGKTWEYDYGSDGTGVLIRTVDPYGNTTIDAGAESTHTYEPQSITDPRPNVWSYPYSS